MKASIETVDYLASKSIFSTWTEVFISFGIWSGIYLMIRRALPHTSAEYCSRIITLVHGTLMTFLGLNQCFIGKILPNTLEPTTTEQSFTLVMSLGYFLTDLSWCLYYQTESSLMIVHHVYSCFTLARILFQGVAGHQATCGLGAMELTNPFLQARWFIRTYGMHDTPLFVSVEITFMIAFFVVRIFLGTILLILFIFMPQYTLELKLLVFMIYIVSWMFMINIGKYFIRRYVRNNVEAELVPINDS